MRLLYVCSDYGILPGGVKGASIHLRAITRALANLGHEVLLLSPRDGLDDAHPVTHALPPGRQPGDPSAKMLKRWLGEHDLDPRLSGEFRSLVYNAFASGRAIEALSANPPDAIVERLSLFGHIGLDLAGAFEVPLVLEVNAPLAQEAVQFRSLHLRSLAEQIEQRVMHQADAVVTVSKELADHLRAGGVEREKLHVVPNGVDLDRFEHPTPRAQARSALGITDQPVIVFVGSLKKWHGVDVLVEAFSQLVPHFGSAKLLIVGTGPMEGELKATVQRLGLTDATIFTGGVAHARIPDLLSTADVAVAPFRSIDQFYFSPIKLFEYMASKVCVVASRLGQLAEVIQDGVNGLLCGPDNATELASTLELALGSSELRERLASQAAEDVRHRYTWTHAGQATENVIREALRLRQSRREPSTGTWPEPLRSKS